MPTSILNTIVDTDCHTMTTLGQGEVLMSHPIYHHDGYATPATHDTMKITSPDGTSKYLTIMEPHEIDLKYPEYFTNKITAPDGKIMKLAPNPIAIELKHIIQTSYGGEPIYQASPWYRVPQTGIYYVCGHFGYVTLWPGGGAEWEGGDPGETIWAIWLPENAFIRHNLYFQRRNSDTKAQHVQIQLSIMIGPTAFDPKPDGTPGYGGYGVQDPQGNATYPANRYLHNFARFGHNPYFGGSHFWGPYHDNWLFLTPHPAIYSNTSNEGGHVISHEYGWTNRDRGGYNVQGNHYYQSNITEQLLPHNNATMKKMYDYWKAAHDKNTAPDWTEFSFT